MTTILEHLVDGIRAVARSNGDSVSPEVVIWPDRDSHWVDVMPQIAERYEVLTLGNYEPDIGQGPGYWLRFKLGLRTEESDAPVLYLPGVSQEDLKASDDCPEELRPIVEFQHRGVFWRQTNGKDWTPAAFLMNRDRGLGAEVSSSAQTLEALALTLGELLRQQATWLLSKQPVTRDLLLGLIQPDAERSILEWLSDPERASAAWDVPQRTAFIDACRNDFQFDPESDGPIHAAGLMASKQGRWKQVWSRYRDSPQNYPGVKELLRAAGAAAGQMKIDVETGRLEDSDVWPQVNEQAETDLRKALAAMTDLTPVDARKRLVELEEEHGHRRLWVWATLGESPLAHALEHLASLAQSTNVAPNGSVAQLTDWYITEGFRADDASLRALAAVDSAQDVAVVRNAVRHVYFEWVDEENRRFQDAYADQPGSYTTPAVVDRQEGTCLIFSDGLRYDLGVRLAELVRAARLQVDLGWHYAALPTITFTAKPALAPVADLFGPGDDLSPVVLETGTEVRNPNLHKTLVTAGYQILRDFDVGEDPTGKAWTEEANIDGLGHDRKADLASAVELELSRLASRIEMLLDAGWKRVEVVTDHGFLNVPGGLPKVELKQHLVANRKGRCARLHESGQAGGHPTVAWRWDERVRFAVARGAGCFEEGKEYEHGGLSLQECVVPHLIISRDETPSEIAVTDLSWAGLRVRIEVEGPAELVDIRTKPADPRSSLIGEPFALKDGSGTAIVPEPDADGLSAVAVVLDSDRRLLAQRPTVVGEE